MKNTADYLDALRARFNVPSDYALSSIIGIAPSHMSRYRKQQGTFSEEFCLKIADWLDIDPAQVILDMHHQREKNQAVKTVWERIAKSMAAVTAALVLAAALPIISSAPNYSDLLSISENRNIHYAYFRIGESGMVSRFIHIWKTTAPLGTNSLFPANTISMI